MDRLQICHISDVIHLKPSFALSSPTPPLIPPRFPIISPALLHVFERKAGISERITLFGDLVIMKGPALQVDIGQYPAIFIPLAYMCICLIIFQLGLLLVNNFPKDIENRGWADQGFA